MIKQRASGWRNGKSDVKVKSGRWGTTFLRGERLFKSLYRKSGVFLKKKENVGCDRETARIRKNAKAKRKGRQGLVRGTKFEI